MPVSCCPGIYLCLVCLMALMPVVAGYNIAETIQIYLSDFLFQLIAEPIVFAWIITALYLLMKLWKRWLATVWLSFCFAVLYINFLIDYFVISIYRIAFNEDIAAVLCATNPSEGYNFFMSYFRHGWSNVVFYTVIILGAFFVGKYVLQFLKLGLKKYESIVRILTLSLIALSFVGCFAKNKIQVRNLRFSTKIRILSHIEKGHKLISVNPELSCDRNFGPTKLIVVIGESHCRNHSSVYGYNKHTQPYQEKLVADSSLFVFQGAKAPAYYTVDCFKRFIGTWDGNPDQKWYEQFSFLEAARKSGYKLLWFSTQSRKGAFDNVVADISDYCDVVKYTNDGMAGLFSASLDDKIFGLIDTYFNLDNREFIVIHIMGCHADYQMRYPESYNYFKPSDYQKLPANQRKIISEYDNAVLYNDYILSEIYKRYKATDAVIVYFSDHAQDLFSTRPDFFGHAILNNPASIEAAKDIPFTIYLTKEYKSKHPHMTERIIEASKGKSGLYTTDIIYSLMDLMGTRFCDNNDVEIKSIF